MRMMQVPRAHAHARDLSRSSLADMRQRIETKRRQMEEAAGRAAAALDERPATRGREEGGAGAVVGAFDAVAHATPQVTHSSLALAFA